MADQKTLGTKKKIGRPPKHRNLHATSLRIDQDLWKEFKLHCIKNSVPITDEVAGALSDRIIKYVQSKREKST